MKLFPTDSALETSPMKHGQFVKPVTPCTTLNDAMQGTSSPESPEPSPGSEGHGPRIKHVCRKAAVVLGKNVATFPQMRGQEVRGREITLSALPKGEKVKLWKKDEETKAGQ